MDFVRSVRDRFIPRIQFYGEPPTHTIELEQLEHLAIERLKVLKCVEAVGQDFIRGSKDYDERLTVELSKLGSIGKSFTLTSNQLKNVAEDIYRDVTSHFILQIAYCRSDSMRRWFIQQESDLFRYRFNLERALSGHTSEAVSEFLRTNNLHFASINSEEFLRFRCQLDAGTTIYGVGAEYASFYKVHFTEVLDLVRRRQVFLKAGYAYVPDVELVTLVVTRFRASLSHSLSRLGLALVPRLADEGARLLPLLTSLSKRYLGEDDFGTKKPLFGAVSGSQVNELARVPGLFPPCMSRLHEALSANHHLRHWGRMQYGLFLKGIGLPVDEALKFWRNSFAPTVDSDQFAKQYSYSIRHNYGKEGKRADYTPYSCMKIISFNQPGTGEFHGCPFRHLDLDLLSQRLAVGGRVPTDQVEAVVKRAKDKQYQLACREFFKAMHPGLSLEDAASIAISHPNQYYELAQKASKGIPLSSSGESGSASQRTNGSKWSTWEWCGCHSTVATYFSYVCPEEVSKGIPFDVYGSPIFPVALHNDHSEEVVTPFWTNISGIWVDNLLEALSTSDVSDCLFEDLPKCESIFEGVMERALPLSEFPQISNHLVSDIRGKKWSKPRLYDFKNTTLVIIRRILLIRCFYWCHAILRLPVEIRPMMPEMCPNPCNQANVCSGTGEVYGTCQLTEEGFFSHQYQCDCKKNYVWDPAVQGCIPENPCERQEKPVCYSNGTLLCSYDRDFNEVSCLCNPEYMAAGNRACNVNNDGNRCLPALDPDLGPTYSCVCAAGRWTGDISLGYDNCLKKVTKCDQIICIKGQCVDSRDGQEAVCICKEGYDSPMCATWTGVWSAWTPWSRCLPACGVERWAIRTRRCLVAERFGVDAEHIDCRGPSTEFTPCDPHSCAPEEGVTLIQYFEIREHALQAVFVLAAVTAAFLALCWRFFFQAKLAVRMRRMFRRPHEL
ncbi:DNA primase large subunit [Taenia crassiceps]|uniref:DNA primase large subunit n=1 Tax=Taenia crassiceps TaxID=6207 RepID=A0ABR4QEG1_9CEST